MLLILVGEEKKKQPISRWPELSRTNHKRRIPLCFVLPCFAPHSKNLTKTIHFRDQQNLSFSQSSLILPIPSLANSSQTVCSTHSHVKRLSILSNYFFLFLIPPHRKKMASRMGSRSVKDATRFTSTIPHATSKSATSAAAAPRTMRIPGETPEQRVKRLRQAHLAAQKAQISRTDRVIDASRRFFDVAHRWTVGGLVMFSGAF